MITSTPNTASPVRSGATSPGKDLRALVRWAIDSRKRAVQYGWSHLDTTTAQAFVGRLEAWERTNPFPSADTIRRFDQLLGQCLRYVVPANAAGKKKLAQYERILFNL